MTSLDDVSTLISPDTSDFAPDGYLLRFPTHEAGHEQDSEWCEVYVDGAWKRLRLHDYDAIYALPGLYEHLFYRTLRCTSPRVVVSLLSEILADRGVPPTTLSVVDVGAGNGMVGEQLRALGVRRLLGLDLIQAARAATDRDRPALYEDFLVTDLTALRPHDEQVLRDFDLNALVTVAALGFGDIPPAAFAAAYNYVADGGFIAFNIKADFLSGADDTGFCRLIRRITEDGALELDAMRRYNHRLSIYGEQIEYVAIVGRKMGDIGQDVVDAVS